MPKQLLFLTSTRFWSVVLIALAVWLAADGFITENLATFIKTVAGGYTIIRTADKAAAKIGK